MSVRSWGVRTRLIVETESKGLVRNAGFLLIVYYYSTCEWVRSKKNLWISKSNREDFIEIFDFYIEKGKKEMKYWVGVTDSRVESSVWSGAL